MISQIIRFIKTDIWKVQFENLSLIKVFFIKYFRVLVLAIWGFKKDECPRRASALTYYSMLSTVPLIAVAFGIAKGFGFGKLIEKQIIQMAGKGNWQGEITDQLLTFSRNLLEHTKGGVIAGVGIILLFWTVISILGKIEESFNSIWEIEKSRSLVRKFSDYLSVVVFTPILFIISSSLTVLFASQIKLIVQKLAFLGTFSFLILFLLKLLPYVSICLLFMMLYVVIPNKKIPFRSGILAGISAGVIYQVVQWFYIHFQIGVSKYGAIYGSFAALPLLLIWIQLSWMIVLFGAEIAFAYENMETYGFHPDYSKLSISSKKILVLRIFHLLVKKFAQGEKPLSANQIAQILEIPVRFVHRLLHELKSVGLVVETTEGTKQETGFQPGRTIEDITVKSTLDMYERIGSGDLPYTSTGEAEKLSLFLKHISDEVEKSPKNVTLKEI
jgi:membrane protein